MLQKKLQTNTTMIASGPDVLTALSFGGDDLSAGQSPEELAALDS